MSFLFAVNYNEIMMNNDGAVMYLVVSDSPCSDKNNRDESSTMGNRVVMRRVDNPMKCDSSAM